MRSPWNGGSISLRWRRWVAPSSTRIELGPNTGSNRSKPRAAPAFSASRSPGAIALIASGVDTNTYGVPFRPLIRSVKISPKRRSASRISAVGLTAQPIACSAAGIAGPGGSSPPPMCCFYPSGRCSVCARSPTLAPVPHDRRERRLALLRVGLLAATLAAVAITALATGFRPSAGELRDWGESLGPAGPVLFIPLSVALGCLLFPGPLLAGAAGLLFGTAVGTPIALVAATLTAVAEMLITRNVAGTRVGALIPERARRVDDFIDRRGFWAVLYMRLAPGIPYHLVNYGAGLTRLRVRDMAGGTAIGALPRTFAYVALGGSLDDLGSPEAIAALALLVLTAVVGGVVARVQIRRERLS